MTEKSKRQKYINHSIYVDTFSVPILVQLNYYSEILDYTPPKKLWICWASLDSNKLNQW